METDAHEPRMPVELRRQLLDAMEANHTMFLAILVDELTLSARGEYEVGGTAALREGTGLRAFNEIIRVVAAQLGRTVGTGARGYPNEAFVDALWESALAGGIQQSVATAIQRTVERVARTSR